MYDYVFHKTIIYSAVLFFNIFGLFGNINIVAIHIRKRELRTKYGILLAFLSFSQTFCLLFEWINVFFGIQGTTVPRSICFPLLIPLLIAHCGQTGLLATISIDLFISISFPIRHRFARTTPYLLVLCLPTITAAILIVTFGYVFVDDTPLEFCNPPNSLAPSVNKWWYGSALGAGCVTIVFYVASYTAIYIRSKRNPDKPHFVERKAMKSLSVLLLVFIFTRFVGTIAGNVMNLMKVDRETVMLFQSYNYALVHNRLFGSCHKMDEKCCPFLLSSHHANPTTVHPLGLHETRHS